MPPPNELGLTSCGPLSPEQFMNLLTKPVAKGSAHTVVLSFEEDPRAFVVYADYLGQRFLDLVDETKLAGIVRLYSEFSGGADHVVFQGTLSDFAKNTKKKMEELPLTIAGSESMLNSLNSLA